MHIKEIEIDSFKSFGRKTTVPFLEGFTAITGPNGSGKSNLIDSILFALGLARTRGMRAERLPDLLYDPPEGESAREGSVKVILDNSDRAVTEEEIRAACDEVGDPDEITIKRRIKRTSKNYYSYYYINGRSVNLSDIRDLLSSAGITPEGYNVVMQGDVTNIIQMSNSERRGIIEQVAGVAEFDEKKEKAHEELETVDERVERVELILDEIEERLERLKDERDKALEYRELKDEKQEYERLLSAAKLQQVEDEIESVQDEIDNEQEKKKDLEDKLGEKKELVEEIKEELEELNREINKKGEEDRLDLISEIEELKGKISRREDRIEDAEETLEEYQKKKREAFVNADKTREEVEELEEDIRETKVKKSGFKSDLSKKKSDLEETKKKIEKIEGEYADTRQALEEAKQEKNDLEERKNELTREKDRLLDSARRRSREIEDLEKEISDAKEDLSETEEEQEQIEDELEKAERNLEELKSVEGDLQKEKKELQSDLEDVEDALREKKEELAQAKAQADSGGGNYGRAVSTVLNSDIDGIHGTIADLGAVSGKYATAVETAAGGRMAYVVVDDDGVGQRCIEYLKSRNAGRATFLPLSKMSARDYTNPPSREGVIDYAYNLVDFDERYAPAFA
ncbi:MAG: AAA family ATPase, partial [Halobacteria archaeon]|nr:AAA family ATPase [Halobacteria archaeon]